ncbi:MAG: MEDS domain-containing protein [Bacillota bacterium]
MDKDGQGLHISYYYYGRDHLNLNLGYYIENYVNKGEKVYLFSSEDQYNSIMNFFAAASIPQSVVNYHTLNEIEDEYGKDIYKMREKVIKEEISNNNQGIKWIFMVDYFIKNTSKEKFMNWEEELTEVFAGTRSSLLCLYNFEDFTSEQKYIDKKVIEHSYESHPYILHQFSLKRTCELQKIK